MFFMGLDRSFLLTATATHFLPTRQIPIRIQMARVLNFILRRAQRREAGTIARRLALRLWRHDKGLGRRMDDHFSLWFFDVVVLDFLSEFVWGFVEGLFELSLGEISIVAVQWPDIVILCHQIIISQSHNINLHKKSLHPFPSSSLHLQLNLHRRINRIILRIPNRPDHIKTHNKINKNDSRSNRNKNFHQLAGIGVIFYPIIKEQNRADWY